jgi:hypothetical protein
MVPPCSGGLDLDKGLSSHAGHKSHLSLAQQKAMKEIKYGKKSTILRALGVGKSLSSGLK